MLHMQAVDLAADACPDLMRSAATRAAVGDIGHLQASGPRRVYSGSIGPASCLLWFNRTVEQLWRARYNSNQTDVSRLIYL
jgi:hypothetical protein